MGRYAWVFRSIVTVALLWAVLSQFPAAQLLPAMLSAEPRYVALGFLCSFVVMVIEAIRFRALLSQHGMTLTARQVLAVNLAAKFYGLFLPGYISGGVFRWVRFAQVERKWGEVLACIVFGRLLDTIMLVLLGVGFWALSRSAGAGVVVGAALLGVLALLLAVHLSMVSGTQFAGRVSAPLKRVFQATRLPDALWDKGAGLARATVDGYRLSQGVIGQMAGLSLLVHVGGMVSFWCFARALHLSISLIEIGWINSVVSVLLMLPISIVGLGVREGSLVVLLSQYGVADSDAVALSLLLFASALALVAAGGVLELRRTLRGPAAPHG